ncbi:MAG: Trk system potassium transporter TrkA [Acidobacteria bacterium]|nr:Trk system potassium transporter TrkA [Acidobacteriota bacterium]
MHVIIVGGGEIGFPLAEALATGHDVFVVDPDPAAGERLADTDVGFVGGSGANPEVLRRAGIERCGVLIAATRLDEVNFLCCALASKLGAPRTICFASREDLLTGGARGLQQHFGIDEVIWPEAELAAHMERVVLAPGATDAGVFVGGRIELLEYRLGDGSPLVGAPVSSLDLPPGVVIVAAEHELSIRIPRGGTRLEAGDKVVLLGVREGMAELRARMAPGAGRGMLRVAIIGAGDVGWRLAQRLDQAGGIELRVIERDRQRGERLAATLRRGLVLEGDGTDLALLESEDIGRSDVLVSVIDNDERNLLASLLGRQLGARKVITRVGNPANHRLFERVGIDVALSACGSAVTSVVHGIDGGRSSLLAILQEGQARVVELTAPPGLRPTAVRDLPLPREAVVGTVLRDGRVFVPGGGDRVEGGDQLIVCCTEAALRDVRDVFAGP